MATIIFVHGTFDGEPSDAAPKWWQDGSPFRTRLTDLVQGDEGPPTIEPFFWSGRNSEKDRREAGLALFQRLSELDERGERMTVVAHSHGGSVVEHALAKAVKEGDRLPALERWITVGTPFFAQKRLNWIARHWKWISFLFISFALSIFLVAPWDNFTGEKLQLLAPGAALVGAIGLLAFWADRRFSNAVIFDERAMRREFGPRLVPLYADGDEAIALLASATRAKLAPVTGAPLRPVLGLAGLGFGVFAAVLWAGVEPARDRLSVSINGESFLTRLQLTPTSAVNGKLDSLKSEMQGVIEKNVDSWVGRKTVLGAVSTIIAPLGNFESSVRNASGELKKGEHLLCEKTAESYPFKGDRKPLFGIVVPGDLRKMEASCQLRFVVDADTIGGAVDSVCKNGSDISCTDRETIKTDIRDAIEKLAPLPEVVRASCAFPLRNGPRFAANELKDAQFQKYCRIVGRRNEDAGAVRQVLADALKMKIDEVQNTLRTELSDTNGATASCGTVPMSSTNPTNNPQAENSCTTIQSAIDGVIERTRMDLKPESTAGRFLDSLPLDVPLTDERQSLRLLRGADMNAVDLLPSTNGAKKFCSARNRRQGLSQLRHALLGDRTAEEIQNDYDAVCPNSSSIAAFRSKKTSNEVDPQAEAAPVAAAAIAASPAPHGETASVAAGIQQPSCNFDQKGFLTSSLNCIYTPLFDAAKWINDVAENYRSIAPLVRGSALIMVHLILAGLATIFAWVFAIPLNFFARRFGNRQFNRLLGRGLSGADLTNFRAVGAAPAPEYLHETQPLPETIVAKMRQEADEVALDNLGALRSLALSAFSAMRGEDERLGALWANMNSRFMIHTAYFDNRDFAGLTAAIIAGDSAAFTTSAAFAAEPAADDYRNWATAYLHREEPRRRPFSAGAIVEATARFFGLGERARSRRRSLR
ncbi:MAG TPA: hypothetical protein DDZ68_11760 [Parvularcula sp.]|nr:hypothetical protein [Parvularcula sp.]HBS31044.1 hypothetical protein [Parvularcula sp.]